MVNRRQLVVGAAGASGAFAGSQALGADARSSQVVSEFIQFDDPAEEFRAHMRIERDLPERQGTTLTWYHWMVFMIPVGRRPEPLIRYEGLEYSYFRKVAPDTFRIHAHNVSFARDLKTNTFADTVVNPVTGKRVEVPVSLLHTDPGTIASPIGFRNIAGDGTAQEVYRVFRRENDLIKLDSVRSAPPDWPATHIENSCQWVEMDLFNNPTITSLPVHFCGHYAFEYPEWLQMPKGNGHNAGFWDGLKINGPEELPREMLDRMEREYPELLAPRWEDFDKPVPFEV